MFSISIAVSMLHTDAPGLFLRSGAFTLCSVLTDAIDGQQVSMQPDCLSQPLTYPPDLCFLFWREWSPELQSTNADSAKLFANSHIDIGQFTGGTVLCNVNRCCRQ